MQSLSDLDRGRSRHACMHGKNHCICRFQIIDIDVFSLMQTKMLRHELSRATTTCILFFFLGNDLHSSTISTKDGVAFRGMYIEWTCWSKIRAPGRQRQLVPTLQVCVNFIPPKLLGQNSKAPTVVCSTITYDRTSSIDQTMRLKETYNKSTAIGYCVWIEFIFDV